MNIIRTNTQDKNFANLVRLLDADLAKRDGDEHSFYAQFSKTSLLKYALVAYKDEEPVGCGALKEFDTDTMEIKRMYTLPKYRGLGIASTLLHTLELWTAELGYKKCILETGLRQPEAIALYKKCNYKVIPNYGQYIGVANSCCFEKIL